MIRNHTGHRVGQDPLTKARALESRVMAQREENRRKFPTAALLMDMFKQFSPTLMMAEENGFHVERKNYRAGGTVYTVKY